MFGGANKMQALSLKIGKSCTENTMIDKAKQSEDLYQSTELTIPPFPLPLSLNKMEHLIKAIPKSICVA